MAGFDPENILTMHSEIHGAESHRDLHLRVTADLIKDYHGPYWREDRSQDLDPAPENHALEWLALVTNKIVYDNPTVYVSSRHSGVPKEVLARMEAGINQWAEMNEFWKTLLKVWYDCAFGFGVIRTTLQPMPGYKGFMTNAGLQIKPQWPVAKRIPPHRFIIDYRCEEFEQARFMGHVWKRDHKDLLKRKGFNHDAIAKIAWDVGLDKVRSSTNTYEGPSRQEIVGYEIWVPEHTLPEARGRQGYHGTIFTMGVAVNGQEASKPQWIKPPRPYFGPSWGPYQMFGVYSVPGSVYPLSPLAATYEQVRELNAHSVAAAKGAAGFKEFVAYDPANPNAGMAAKHARHGEVVPIENMTEAIQQIKLGGVQREQYEYIGTLRERRDRVTGLTDAARGNVSGVGTATEIADAAAQRDSRLSLIERMFHSATVGSINTVGWFMFNSEFVRFKMSGRSAVQVRPRPSTLPHPSQAERIATELEMEGADDPFNMKLIPFNDRVELIRQQLEWNPEVTFPVDDPGESLESMASQNGLSYEDLQLILDPTSMKRVDQALLQKQAQDQFTLISQMSTVMAQTPWINWVGMFDEYGNSLNKRDFSSVIFPEVLAQFQQQNMGVMEQMGDEGQMVGDSVGGAIGQGVGGPVAPSTADGYIAQGRSSGRNVSKAVR